MTEKLDETAKKPDLIFDVGMHRGQDSDFYLRRGYRVVAFEANPENAAICRDRFAKEIDEGRLTIVEGAVTESALEGEKVVFYRNKDHSFWGSTNPDWASRNEVLNTSNERIEVRKVGFVEAIRQYGVPFYLKADIVGDEIVCLKALTHFVNKPDYISIRSEKVIFRKLEEEIELFAELGYDRFKAIQQDIYDWTTNYISEDGAKVEYTFGEGASGPFGEETPGQWKDRLDVLKQYKRIFTMYWLFGDYSFLVQTENGKRLITGLERLVRRPLPGWYDTHAKHSSVGK